MQAFVAGQVVQRQVALVAQLAIGRLRALSQGDWLVFAVSEGFAKVQFDKVIVLADTAEEAGKIDIPRAEKAIERVPPEEQPPYAELWCRRAEALVSLDRIETAIESYIVCSEWTHGVPELLGLREEALRRAQELGGE